MATKNLKSLNDWKFVTSDTAVVYNTSYYVSSSGFVKITLSKTSVPYPGAMYSVFIRGSSILFSLGGCTLLCESRKFKDAVLKARDECCYIQLLCVSVSGNTYTFELMPSLYNIEITGVEF